MNISTKVLALAAAVMVGVGASAQVATVSKTANARPVSRKTGTEITTKASLQATGNYELTVNTNGSAVQSRADSWTDFQTGTFNTTINQLIAKWDSKYPNTKLQKRDTDEENVTEYRILNPLGFIDDDNNPMDDLFSPILVGTTYEEVGEIINIPQCSTPITLSSNGAPIHYWGKADWYAFLLENNLYGITQEDVDNASGRSYFDEVQGRYTLDIAWVIGEGGGEDIWKSIAQGTDNFQLNGNYPSYDFGYSNPYFFNENGNGYLNLNIQMADNAYVAVYIEEGELEDAEVQAEYKNLVQNPGDYQQFDQSGYCKIELPNEVAEGPYTMILAAFTPDGKYSGIYFYLDAKLPEEGWTLYGAGEYQDGIVCNAINSFSDIYPDGYRAEVLFEKSTETAGYYRVHGAFATMGTKLSSYYSNVEYDQDVDVMLIHAEDPTKVYIEQGSTGISIISDDVPSTIEYTSDIYNTIDEPENLDPEMYGTCKDYVITFPKGDPEADFSALYCIMDGNQWAANQEGTFKLVLPEGYVGVSSVVADQNAPVVYYNLQGQRVNNAQNGLFIRTQGNKAEKVVL